jgi:hypothetical protein
VTFVVYKVILTFLRSPYVCHSSNGPASYFIHQALTRCDINNWQLALFQASAAVSMRPLFFWDVTQFRLILTAVSGKPIWSIFRGHKFKKNSLFDLEGVTDGLSRNVGNYQSSFRNIQEERRSYDSFVK